MESRKIIIVENGANSTVTLNTDATTFGELKAAARAAGVNFEGKDWTEGITRTKPVDDNSLLPTNVVYKGQVTNSLCYLLTTPEKKTRSGMTRKEAYALIAEGDHKDAIKAKFGKNYTNVPTDDLVAFLAGTQKAEETLAQEVPAAQEPAEEPAAVSSSYYKEKYKNLIEVFAYVKEHLYEDVQADIEACIEAARKSAEEAKPKDVNFSASDIKKMFN